ncbi:MAG: TRAM domain-containing protein [Phycisphaerales bacterium]|nr:TRAM domain-containing protein [Phycisphaerales bacterium]MCB9856303.1 TRAM domain-containing protein [Phycisphaerales bacterium]MCB9863258.1 TRAM domain-containing protein [Phycisphaerales bacterium]
MLQHFLRLFLVLALLAAAKSVAEEGKLFVTSQPILVVGTFFLAVIVVVVEILIPRKSLQALAGVFFGLAVGMLVAYCLNLVVDIFVSAFFPTGLPMVENSVAAIAATKFMLGIISCYYCISFVLQTKDDIRFVIPYVEFAKQLKGERPILLDTSVIIDGRIAEICDTGIIDQPLIVPRFVLQELQTVADSSDKLKRVRGRRGLDILNGLQTNTRVEVQIHEPEFTKEEAGEPVDSKLLTLAQKINGRVATNDYNLNKLGKVRGVDIININDLANALKPVALPGEALTVKIIKPGEEGGQGVGYLDDGTMVVVDNGRESIGQVVEIAVTSMLQTSAGRMIFGRIDGADSGGQSSPRGARRRPPQK